MRNFVSKDIVALILCFTDILCYTEWWKIRCTLTVFFMSYRIMKIKYGDFKGLQAYAWSFLLSLIRYIFIEYQ